MWPPDTREIEEQGIGTDAQAQKHFSAHVARCFDRLLASFDASCVAGKYAHARLLSVSCRAACHPAHNKGS
jgi:hypothetical protein